MVSVRQARRGKGAKAARPPRRNKGRWQMEGPRAVRAKTSRIDKGATEGKAGRKKEGRGAVRRGSCAPLTCALASVGAAWLLSFRELISLTTLYHTKTEGRIQGVWQKTPFRFFFFEGFFPQKNARGANFGEFRALWASITPLSRRFRVSLAKGRIPVSTSRAEPFFP